MEVRASYAASHITITSYIISHNTTHYILVKSDYTLWLLLPIAVVHALLSTEVSRMLYLFSAPLAIYMGLILQFHPISVKIKSVFI